MLSLVKIVLKIFVVAALAAIAVAGFRIADNIKSQTAQAAQAQKSPVVASMDSQIEKSHFQGVFLNSGQVYFGKLQRLDAENYKLTDVYYLNDSNTLVKLGSEPHQPEDAMVIPVASVTFWENLANANQFNGQLR